MKWSLTPSQPNAEPGETAAEEAAYPTPAETTPAASADDAGASKLIDSKVAIHRLLLEKLNLNALDKAPQAQIRKEISDIVGEWLRDTNEVFNRAEREALVDDVLDELLGLGPLEPLLKDESITDILVNGPHTVFVERGGLLERVKTQFQDDRHLMRIIQKIVSNVGRRIDESSPYVDAGSHRSLTPQRADLRRYGLRQDHAAQRHVLLHR
jgi:pilus assembly protein CpaF